MRACSLALAKRMLMFRQFGLRDRKEDLNLLKFSLNLEN